MEQHAVPQNVTSYQFRLIGDMTVKQFLELAAGVLCAWMIFSRPLYPLLKWPLGLGSAFLGFALAFLPIEERPLDVWIKNFTVSLLKPTLFMWHKQPHKLKSGQSRLENSTQNKTKVRLEPAKEKLAAYLQSIELPVDAQSKIDQWESSRLTALSHILGSPSPPVQITNPSSMPTVPTQVFVSGKTGVNQNSGVRLRKLRPVHMVKNVSVQAARPSPPPAPPQVQTPASNQMASIKIQPINELEGEIPAVAQTPPLAPPLKVDSLSPPEKSSRADFIKDLAMPFKPDRPNLLSGMVTDYAHHAIPNTIIEVKNSNHETVRALKSNKLGQFFMATPLENNKYYLFAEHPNYNFDIIEVELVGNIISPLKIMAKERQT